MESPENLPFNEENEPSATVTVDGALNDDPSRPFSVGPSEVVEITLNEPMQVTSVTVDTQAEVRLVEVTLANGTIIRIDEVIYLYSSRCSMYH